MRFQAGWLGVCAAFMSALAVQMPIDTCIERSFSSIVVFGDSLVDNGNGTYQLTNREWPAPCCTWQGRFSSGPTWPEELAGLLQVSQVQDFAYGGSTSNNKNVQGKSGYNESIPVPDLVTQVSKYLHTAKDQRADPHAVYILSTGSNDLYYGSQKSLHLLKMADQAVDTIKCEAKKLIDLGANTVVLSSITDMGLTPSFRHYGNLVMRGGSNAYMLRFNQNIREAVKELQQPNIQVMLADLYKYSEDIYKSAKRHGIKNTTDACLQGFSKTEKQHGVKKHKCDNPDEYLYWDLFHPTNRAHQLLAQAVKSDLF